MRVFERLEATLRRLFRLMKKKKLSKAVITALLAFLLQNTVPGFFLLFPHLLKTVRTVDHGGKSEYVLWKLIESSSEKEGLLKRALLIGKIKTK